MIYKKGKPFLWEKEQQEAFDKIKKRMLKPPVLSMPNRKGRFILYSDTSKIATGSTLYQHQDRKPRLIAYASKRMPKAAKIIPSQSGNMWIGYQYCHILTSVKKSRL